MFLIKLQALEIWKVDDKEVGFFLRVVYGFLLHLTLTSVV